MSQKVIDIFIKVDNLVYKFHRFVMCETFLHKMAPYWQNVSEDGRMKGLDQQTILN